MKIGMIGGRGLPDTYSGLEVFLKELSPRLVSRGHEVIVYCRPGYYTIPEYQGVKLVRVPSIPTRRLDTMIHSLMSSIRAVRDRVDIFHFNAIGPGSLAFVPRLVHRPSVVTIHSLNWKHSKWNKAEKMAIKSFEYWAVRVSDCLVAVSKQHQDYLQTNYGKTVFHIPNGVTLTPRLPAGRIRDLGVIPDGYILYAGRLSREKGCHYLVEAFKRLETQQKLVIAGDGPNEDDYVKSLKADANDRVLFLGHVSSGLLSELYSNASIYVLPSESEGLSISLLEAMSYGCCVVTSDIKENLDVICHCGLSFESGNVDMLSRTLNSLLKDYPLRTAMGLKAKDHVDRLYNWEDVCAKYERLYRALGAPAASGQRDAGCAFRPKPRAGFPAI